jgi:hypothetical protein
MAAKTPARRRAAAAVAALERHRNPNDPAVIEARVKLAEATARDEDDEHIRALVRSAGRLNDHQRARLAALLPPPSTSDSAA